MVQLTIQIEQTNPSFFELSPLRNHNMIFTKKKHREFNHSFVLNSFKASFRSRKEKKKLGLFRGKVKWGNSYIYILAVNAHHLTKLKKERCIGMEINWWGRWFSILSIFILEKYEEQFKSKRLNHISVVQFHLDVVAFSSFLRKITNFELCQAIT